MDQKENQICVVKVKQVHCCATSLCSVLHSVITQQKGCGAIQCMKTAVCIMRVYLLRELCSNLCLIVELSISYFIINNWVEGSICSIIALYLTSYNFHDYLWLFMIIYAALPLTLLFFGASYLWAVHISYISNLGAKQHYTFFVSYY